MLAKITSTSLSEYIGTQFDVLDDPAKEFRITLTDVVEHAKTEKYESFSLFFHGRSALCMQQGIRQLKHEHLGELSIFLVPVGQDADGFQYEAVFNHMIK